MNRARNLALVSGLAVLALILLLRWNPDGPSRQSAPTPLLLYCAAGMKAPVESAARTYERIYGIPIQIQYGGSGTLLSNLRVARKGDLFLAADESYLLTARSNQLLKEIIPLSRVVPVIAVRRGNPKNIRTVSDLLRVDVALANPDAAAIGRITRERLTQSGEWAALEKHARVFKPTVSDVANDVKMGTVDAGIIWNATARQYPELEMVPVPNLASIDQHIVIGVLQCSEQPTAALRFARYLGARDRGLQEFIRYGYEPVAGDIWAETPEVVLFSSNGNRQAIETTIQHFEEREGARVTRIYHDCAPLNSQIRSGKRPDAFFTGDVSCLTGVETFFFEPVTISTIGLGATAIQSFAIGKHSEHRYLTERLQARFREADSRKNFEAAGFRWWTEGQ